MANKKGVVPKIRSEPAFQRSPKTPRTPPKVVKSTPIRKPTESSDPKNASVYLCQICATEDDVEKIRCDNCMQWYHFHCAHVPRQVMQQESWLCVSCKNKMVVPGAPNPVQVGTEKSSENPTPAAVATETIKASTGADLSTSESSSMSQQASVISQQAVTKKANSRTGASVISSRRKGALALQCLEEARLLIEQRDKEARKLQGERDKQYLMQKYALLEDEAMSNLSFDDQEVEFTKFDSVRQWTESIQDVQFGNMSPPINENQVANATLDNAAPNGADGNVTAINLETPTSISRTVVQTDDLPSWLTHPVPIPLEHPWVHVLEKWKKDLNKQNPTTTTTTASSISQGVSTFQRDTRYDFPQPLNSATHQTVVTSSNQTRGRTQVNSQPQLLGATITTIDQQLKADQTVINGPANHINFAFGTNHQRPMSVSHSTLIGANLQPSMGTAQPQLFGTIPSAPIKISQQSSIDTTTTTTIVQPVTSVQPLDQLPFIGPYTQTSQAQTLGASQMQYQVASQSQTLDTSQPQILTGQHQPWCATQPHLRYAPPNPDASQSNYFGPTSNVSRTQLWNTSSNYQTPPITTISTYVSSNQLFSASQNMYNSGNANSRWFKAPEFLYNTEQDWTNQDKNFITKEELRPCFLMSIREIRHEQLIDLERFSQWNRLIRAQAYVLRFVNNARNVRENRLVGSLEEELIRAKIQFFHRAYRDAFLDEIQMLNTKRPTYEMLVTLMAEVENIVNSRPLTYISLDHMDDEALTPNHFLLGSSNAMKPIGETMARDLNRNDWRDIQEMTKHFWHRVVMEYLPDLTKRAKWFKQAEPINVGDVVVNIDEKQPKNTWEKGIVEDVIVAKDGCIRQVIVRFARRILKRPVSKLAILDVKLPNEQDVKLDQTGPVNGGKDVVQHCNSNTVQTVSND